MSRHDEPGGLEAFRTATDPRAAARAAGRAWLLPAAFCLHWLLSACSHETLPEQPAGAPVDPRAVAGTLKPAEFVAAGGDAEKRSAPGEYQGYGAPRYDSYRRTSEYVAVRDGTRLALDIYRPARNGQVERGPLPTVFLFTCYGRSAIDTQTGEFMPNDPMGEHQPGPDLLAHGYVIVVGDARGFGASFGSRTQNALGTVDGRDGADLIGWIARQAWSDGKVGMTGISWPGLVQLFVAAEGPPALKAIFPKMTNGPDVLNNLAFGMNGVLFSPMTQTWSQGIDDQEQTTQILPVDADRSGLLLRQAKSQRTSVAELLRRLFDESQFYRDENPQPAWTDVYELPRRINAAGIPVYLLGGWQDAYSPDILYRNLDTPKKWIMGFWTHTAGQYPEGYADPRAQDSERVERIETRRWFDYWLKGVDNGIMKEAPIRYAVMDVEDRSWTWRSSEQWPLPEALPRRYYLSGTASGTLEARIDGTLASERPAQSRHAARVDYSATSGEHSRTFSAFDGVVDYGDMSGNDAKGFAYTSAPLAQDLEVVGYPIVELFVTSSEPDEDYLVYLQEVDAQGRSHYITEGAMRGSFRTLGTTPYETFGLPMTSMSAADRRAAPPLDAGTAKLRFWLMPTANRFDAGHRIRITVQAADVAGIYEPLIHDPPAQRTIFLGGTHASSIVLPVQRAAAASAALRRM